jgi:hypothetical protein
MAALPNLTIAIMKLGGHHNIAAAARHHAREALGPWPRYGSAQHEQNGHYVTCPAPWRHPACDTMPVPPAVRPSPFSQPAAFTLRVLLDLARYMELEPLSFQVQEHLLASSRHAPA